MLIQADKDVINWCVDEILDINEQNKMIHINKNIVWILMNRIKWFI